MPKNHEPVDDVENVLGHIWYVNNNSYSKLDMSSCRWGQLDVRFHGMGIVPCMERGWERQGPPHTGPETWDKWMRDAMRKVLGCREPSRRMAFDQRLACVESGECETMDREWCVLTPLRRYRETDFDDP